MAEEPGVEVVSWVKIDDQFPDHPKVIAAGPVAAWLYVCGLAYCARLLTDGFIPAAQVRKLADIKDVRSHAERLVKVGLWERVEGGFVVHDYLDYQPSAERVRAIRSARAAAGSRGGKQTRSKTQANCLDFASGLLQAKSNPGLNPSINPTPLRNTSSPPSPIAHAREAPAAAASSSYLQALAEGFSQISADFRRLDPELSSGWLRQALTTAESRAGPLEPEQIVSGLELAILRIERAVAAPSPTHPIRNLRGFATTAVAEALEEQAHAHAS